MVFDRLLEIWNDGDPEAVRALVTTDYVGHMLHLPASERTAEEYPGWIRRYRAANSGARFVVADQSAAADRLWTRVEARLPDGRVAHGMNVSRFEGELIAEEWAVWSPWLP
jgi:hypothetical protein